MKWKQARRANMGDYYSEVNLTIHALEAERNEALDLLEEMVTHCRWDRHGTRLIPKARALLDRLRVKDCHCTTAKEGAVIQIDDLGKCSHCGRCVANPRQTVRERVIEAWRANASEGRQVAIEILADAIDELKEKIK